MVVGIPHNLSILVKTENVKGIEGCIFDLDGVLVDTAVFHYHAWKRLANSLGADFSESDNEKLKGISRMESLRLILSWIDQPKSPEAMHKLANRKNDWYLELVAQMSPEDVLPGSRELLSALRKSGLPIALGSASKNARMILEKTALISYFDEIVDGNLVSLSKPHPAVFQKGAELLGIEPFGCLVFEDAVAGIQAARNAGMNVIGIGDPAVLYEADRIFPSLAKIQLTDLLL